MPPPPQGLIAPNPPPSSDIFHTNIPHTHNTQIHWDETNVATRTGAGVEMPLRHQNRINITNLRHGFTLHSSP
ncbi:hypothetical protein T484DRAFT_1646967 [Baffinella frigidus]|nr:hypothetical protein T484DRAFT_1646967 [Cryptophyta sp. CCMP2293]